MAMQQYMSLHHQDCQIQWDDLALIGKRRTYLEKVLFNPNTQWEKIALLRWYGEKERTVEICTGVAVWYHTGLPYVPSALGISA